MDFPADTEPVPVILVIAAGANEMENRPAKAELYELSLHGNLSNLASLVYAVAAEAMPLATAGSRKRAGLRRAGNTHDLFCRPFHLTAATGVKPGLVSLKTSEAGWICAMAPALFP